MALAAAIFLVCSVVVMRRQPSLESATLLAGATAWLAGNVMLFEGRSRRSLVDRVFRADRGRRAPRAFALYAAAAVGTARFCSPHLSIDGFAAGAPRLGRRARAARGVALRLRSCARNDPSGPAAALCRRVSARRLFLAAWARAHGARRELRRRAARGVRRLRVLHGLRPRPGDPAGSAARALPTTRCCTRRSCFCMRRSRCGCSSPPRSGPGATPRRSRLFIVVAVFLVTVFDRGQSGRAAPR